MRREVAEGHRVENHGWTHRPDFGLDTTAVLDEIDRPITASRSSPDARLIDEIRARGYQIVPPA